MFNRIGIENFRVFKDYSEFELAPITILTGTNNSGKSSLIKLLSLLKHSFNKENGINKLDFDGGNHKLGTFENIINWDSDSKRLKVNFDFPLKYFDEKFKLELIYVKEKEDAKLVSFKVYNNKRILLRFLTSDNENNFMVEESKYLQSYYTIDLEYLKHTMCGNKNPIKENQLFFKYFTETEENGKKIKEDVSKKYSKYLKIFESLFGNYYYEFDEFDGTENWNIFTNSLEMVLGIRTHGDELSWYFNSFELKGNKDSNGMTKEIFLSYFNANQKKQYFEETDEVSKLVKFFNDIPNIKIKVNDFYKKDIQKYIQDDIEKGIDKILYSINSIDHLTVSRGSQERILSNKSTNEIDEIVKKFFFIKDYIKEKEFLNKSFKILDIKGELDVEREEGVLSKIYIKKENQKIPLSDLGFGYSQVIPILLKIIIISDKKEEEWYENNPYEISDLPFDIIEEAKREQEAKYKSDPNMKSVEKDVKSVLKSKTPREIKDFTFSMLFDSSLSDLVEKETKYPILIVEEPEANLHPNLQSKLADIFYLAYKTFGVHFIIESHSEYLIRKLQYLIANNDSELKTNEVAVYYFNDPDNLPKGQDQIYKLKIREDGFMDNDFGQGFFDEATSLSLSLLNLKNFN